MRSAKTLIIEWYDGLVRGLVSTSTENWYYCSRLAWDLSTKQQVYGFFAVEDKGAILSIKNLIDNCNSEEAFEAIRREEKKLILVHDGNVYLALTTSLEVAPVAWGVSPKVLAEPYLGSSIEETLTPEAIDRWIFSMNAGDFVTKDPYPPLAELFEAR